MVPAALTRSNKRLAVLGFVAAVFLLLFLGYKGESDSPPLSLATDLASGAAGDDDLAATASARPAGAGNGGVVSNLGDVTSVAASSSAKASKITRHVVHADAHNVVSVAMAAAMQSSASYSGLTHEYFSESRSREYIATHYGIATAQAFDCIVAIPVRSTFFALAYLAREGGIWIAPYATSVMPLNTIIDLDQDTFVWAQDKDGYADGALLAASPGHPLVIDAFERTVAGTKARLPQFATKPFWGLTLTMNNKSTSVAVTAAKAAVRTHKRESLPDHPFDHVAQLIIGYKAQAKDIPEYHGARALAEVEAGKSPLYFRFFGGAAFETVCPFEMTERMMLVADGTPDHVFALVDTTPVVPAKFEAATPSRIPHVAFQTNKESRVPFNVRRAMQSIVDHNPTFEMRFFTDELQDEYMQKYASPEALAAYAVLVPHAFRSDLFRYVYLEREGGCYFDSDFVAVQSFEGLLDEHTGFISAEDNGIGFLYNAMMCAEPKHPLISKVLNMSVTRVQRRFYDHSALSITGPGVLGDAFDQLYGTRAREFMQGLRGIRLLSYRRDEECGAGYIKDEEGQKYFATAFPEYRFEMKHLNHQKPYWLFVEEKSAYRESSSAPVTTAAEIDAFV